MNEAKPLGLCRTDGASVPLRAVEMEGELLGGMLCMTVRQRYENVERTPIEALYTFPLPSEATLVGFSMQCSERRLDASVQEREAAFATYHEGLLAGDGAALLDQERPNVFSASVGNLLPGEKTLIEVRYVQQIRALEGRLRIALPTLVAPRYIPGRPGGDRTAHGTSEPTDRVPDADRISPAIGAVDYAVSLQLRLVRTSELRVESPSHRLAIVAGPSALEVSFAAADVPLDRDVVICVEGAESSALTSVLAHKQGDAGYFMLSHLPDLGEAAAGRPPLGMDAVFLIDRSGSMDGASIDEARRALRLCLRQLREGDRFAILAFDDRVDAFRAELVPFTQKTLDEADAWIEALRARGGTELLQPLRAALALTRPPATAERAAPRRACVVLLTDGQVGNEDELLREVRTAGGATPIHSFGIGTNVSDALLGQLARHTRGGVELIHPGERIDEKVVATFARAIARSVRDLRIECDGIELRELAPATPPALIDGEPWSMFGRYRRPGLGALELRGTLDGEPWYLRVPVELPDRAEQPNLPKLWAAESVRELEHSELELHGRRATKVRDQIATLACEHGIASRYTSFVVIEQRSGARRASDSPAARPIPVHGPAGWSLFEGAPRNLQVLGRASAHGVGAVATAPQMFRMQVSAPAPYAGADASSAAQLNASPAFGSHAAAEPALGGRPSDGPRLAAPRLATFSARHADDERDAAATDPAFAILSTQLASGLWASSAAQDPAGQLLATADQLLALLRLGVDSSHPTHGALIRKALGPFTQLSMQLAAAHPNLVERALSIAWLCATGPKTRRTLRDAITRAGLGALAARLNDDSALRAAVLGEQAYGGSVTLTSNV